MKKSRILALLLALAMVMGLMSACGSSSTSTTSASEAATSEASASEVAEEEAEEAAEETTVNVGAAVEQSSTVEGATVAITVSDPMEAMAEEYISYPLEGEDNTISIWYYIPGYQDYMDSNYSFNALATAEEATGVSLEFVEVSSSAASELFNMMIASGDYCDLIPVMEYYANTLADAYENDIILDINDYIDEYMPNYAAVLACLDESTVNNTLTDGHTLVFYQIKDGSYSGNGLVTRSDWMEALDWEWSGDLISLEEFTEYLELVYAAYGCSNTIYMYDGTVGVEAAFDTAIPTLVGDGFMTSVTSAIFRYGDTVTSGWITDGYREYIEWCLQMFEEGIMDQDFLSLDTDRAVTNQLQADGSIAVWQSNADKINEIVDSYGSEYPELAVAGMPYVTADPSEQYVWNDAVSLVSSSSGFSISSTCKNPELVCMWENYFWTTDGYNQETYDTQGESYQKDGATAVFDWNQPITVTGANAPNAEMAQQLFTMIRFVGYYCDNDMLLATFDEVGLNAVSLWTVDGSTDDRNYPSEVSSSFDAEESQQISDYESDLLTYTAEQCLKFMTGAEELNDETWANYVATCESMGINEIIAVYQNAYDQYLAGER